MAKIPEHFKPTRKRQLKEMVKRLTEKLQYTIRCITMFKPHSKGKATAQKIRRGNIKMWRRSLDATRKKIYMIQSELKSL